MWMWSCRYEIAEHFVLMVSIIMSSALLFNKLTPVGHRRPRDLHSLFLLLFRHHRSLFVLWSIQGSNAHGLSHIDKIPIECQIYLHHRLWLPVRVPWIDAGLIIILAGPLLLDTLFKHYLSPRQRSDDEKNKAREDLMYDEGVCDWMSSLCDTR